MEAQRGVWGRGASKDRGVLLPRLRFRDLGMGVELGPLFRAFVYRCVWGHGWGIVVQSVE